MFLRFAFNAPDLSAVVLSFMSISLAMGRLSVFYGTMSGVMSDYSDMPMGEQDGRSSPLDIPTGVIVAFLLSPILIPLVILLFFYVVGLALDVIDCFVSL